MWLRFRCTLCGGGIKIGEELAGRKVRCPFCLCATAVPAAGVASGGAVWVAASKAAAPVAVSLTPASAVIDSAPKPATEPGLALLGSDSAVATVPEPKKRKKKKRRLRHEVGDEPEKMDEWLQGLIILGVTVGVLLLVAVIGVLAGHGFDVFFYTILSIALLPPTLIGLAISMVVASMMLGGVNFGDLRAAITKATALCLITNLIWLVPHFGMFLAGPVWLVGLMALYRLDMFETCLIWVVNFALGWVVQIAIMALVGSMLLGGAGGDIKLDMPDSGPGQFKVPGDLKGVPRGKALPSGKEVPGGKEPDDDDDG
jgi:hypothetical protein